MGGVTVLPVHASLGGWELMPQLKERVMRFCREYDTESSPEALWRQAEISFVSNNPTALLFAAVDDRGRVVGHALLTVEEYLGRKSLNVNQLQTDGNVPRDDVRRWMEAIGKWALSRGIEEMRCIALDARRARAFERLYGFHGERVIMTKRLAEEV